jgi:AraC-like DNA-binding protein
MLLTISLAGIFLSAILLYFNGRKYPSAIYLGVFFLLISLYGIIQHILLDSGSVFLVSIIFLNFGFLPYLIGPMIYWYVRSVLTDNPFLRKKDLWHLLPSAIVFINTLPHMFSSYSYKSRIAASLIGNPNPHGLLSSTLLHGIIPDELFYLGRPLMVLAYTIWSAMIFIKYLKENRNSEVMAGQRYIIRYLAYLLGFLFILAVSYFHFMMEVFTAKDMRLFDATGFLQVLSGIGLAGMLITPFFFPGILYGMPHLPETILIYEQTKGSKKVMPNEGKTQSPGFGKEYLDYIGQKTDSSMTEFKPYLQRDCNLASMSQLTNIPAHHLAYYFREERKRPFNDFRNGYRISHAKSLMIEGKSKELTLEAIGYLSGFSSRKTFFNVFKKAEGISPREFIQQQNL